MNIIRVILLALFFNFFQILYAQSELIVHDSIVFTLDEGLYQELILIDSNIQRKYLYSDYSWNDIYDFCREFDDYYPASEKRRKVLEKLLPLILDLSLKNIKKGIDPLENYFFINQFYGNLKVHANLAPYLYELGLKLRGFEKYLIQDGQIALPETMKKSFKEVIISNDRGYLTLIDRKSQEWLDWWNSLTPEEQIRHNDTSGAGDFLLPTHLARRCIQLSFSQHGNLTKEKLQEIRKKCGHDWESRGLESVRCMNQELISLHEQGILKHNTSK